MTERVAIHCTPRELEVRLGGEAPSSSYCIPVYNLAPPGALLVIGGKEGRRTTERVPWKHPTGQQLSVSVDELPERLTDSGVRPVVLPVSGFYLWKTSGERAEYPFYVCPQHEAFFLIGGVRFQSSKDHKPMGVLPIHQPANALIQPLDVEMPWVVPNEKLDPWLRGEWVPHKGSGEAVPGLGITEMTVHRVGAPVNELDRDGKELIQPLPR
ncbi:MAG: SOS response-associated peptidase family protein [Balneolaceae bacterium]